MPLAHHFQDFWSPNHFTEKRMSNLSYAGPCSAQLWTAMSYVVTFWDPSSALVLLDIKRNWVDKSSLLLYDELLHFLSFHETCWESLKNVCSPWLQFTDILSPILLTTWIYIYIIFFQLMLMQREFEGLSFFFCPQFNLWSSSPPFWKITRNWSSEQWCLLLTFEKRKEKKSCQDSQGFLYI